MTFFNLDDRKIAYLWSSRNGEKILACMHVCILWNFFRWIAKTSYAWSEHPRQETLDNLTHVNITFYNRTRLYKIAGGMTQGYKSFSYRMYSYRTDHVESWQVTC